MTGSDPENIYFWNLPRNVDDFQGRVLEEDDIEGEISVMRMVNLEIRKLTFEVPQVEKTLMKW